MSFRLSTLLACVVSLSLSLLPLDAEAASASSQKRTSVKSGKARVVKVSSKSRKQVRKPVKRVKLSYKRQKAGYKRVMAYQPQLANPINGLALYSSSALVVNAVSGERIFEKNSQVVAPIASITKLMTSIVVLDMHLPLHEPITITEDDVDTLKNSSSRLMVGTTLTRGEMLHLALMASENRAAHALARTAPGGLDAFIARMNRTAISLGMQRSHFVDPTGLNSANVSTAEDLIRLVQSAHHYPEIRSLSTSEAYSFYSNVNGRPYEFRNTNPLVKSENWQIGISKTGYISEAGKCLVMHATINDTPVVIVLLDSAGKLTRIGDANRIKRWLETSPNAILRAG
ncbi:serine hydrolase [Chitinimonas sp. BJYL2]|uniref:serine hydrolase n=1 Tax=Chitinimonas sp. BJYL2 TaxID=2976696 RepID=UPI0022B5381D|nr:serine hydrolase [Chitinimonas sp. BJYL2]